MFEFNLLENEKINLITDEVLLKYQDTTIQVSIIITSKRFLIFNFIKNNESFRVGRMIDNFKTNKKEIIFETNINNVKEIIPGKKYDKYIFNDTNYLYLHNEEVKKYFKENNHKK